MDRSEALLSDEKLLQQLNDAKTRQYAGLIIYVGVVAILGIFGNTSALVFYMKQKKQTVTTVLILALTINDLLMSLFILTNIYDFFHTLTFPSDVWCKLYYLVIHVFVVNSLLFLSAIGVERFVLIHHWPIWKKALCQISSTKYIISSSVFTSAILALRDIWLIECAQVDVHAVSVNRTIHGPHIERAQVDVNAVSVNRTIHGLHCMHSRRPSLADKIVAFHILDLCFLVFITMVLIVIYSLIARRVATVRKNLDDHSKRSSVQIFTESGLRNSLHLSDDTNAESRPVGSKEQCPVSPVSSTEEHPNSTTSQLSHGVNTQLHSLYRRKHKKRMEKRITMMMFAITAASLMSFVPYFVISFLQTYDHTSSAWEVLAHRSYVINSTLNPFIIGFFNSEFRRFIVDRVLCCGRRVEISQ